MAAQAIPFEQRETIASFPFTTLEGLFQALQMIAYERPEMSRGEIYPEDKHGNPIACLELRRNALSDGSQTIDAVLISGRG